MICFKAIEYSNFSIHIHLSILLTVNKLKEVIIIRTLNFYVTNLNLRKKYNCKPKIILRLVINMSRPKTPLVPESRDALTKFKMECAQEIGHLQFVKENNDHYKGDVPAKVNGLEGGPIGGQMVKRMIQMAENQLV